MSHQGPLGQVWRAQKRRTQGQGSAAEARTRLDFLECASSLPAAVRLRCPDSGSHPAGVLLSLFRVDGAGAYQLHQGETAGYWERAVSRTPHSPATLGIVSKICCAGCLSGWRQRRRRPSSYREEFLRFLLDLFDYSKYSAFMAKRARRMGRPPKKASDRLSEIVTLRMTPAAHKQLMKDARAAGLSISGYLLECWWKVREES